MIDVKEVRESFKNGYDASMDDLTAVDMETADRIVAAMEFQEREIKRLKEFNVTLAEGFVQNNEYAREINQEKISNMAGVIEKAYWHLMVFDGDDDYNGSVKKAQDELEGMYLRGEG